MNKPTILQALLALQQAIDEKFPEGGEASLTIRPSNSEYISDLCDEESGIVAVSVDNITAYLEK